MNKLNICLKSILIITLIFTFIFLTSCRFNREFVKKNTTKRHLGLIAVIELENLTEYVNAGRDVTYILGTELYTRNFRIIPEHEVKKRFDEKEVNAKELIKKHKYREIGVLLGVDHIIIGNVTEYRYKHGLGDDPAAGINLRMLSCKTGEMVWASSGSLSGGRVFLHDRSLNEVAQKLCKRMVNKLHKKLEDTFVIDKY